MLPRVIIRFAKYNGASELERKHVGAICQLLLRDNFRYSVRGSLDLVCERGVCRFVPKDRSISVIPEMPLEEGINKIPGFSGIICLGSGVLNSSSNVYKISIQANLSSAIIVGSLRVRSRADGDAYFYGGMTHKLKKVLNDRGIPPSRRSLIPIIVDDKGIVWVPGLGVRDDSPSSGEKNNLIISFSVPMIDDGVELFSALKET
jgi:tRNA(Ile)-lysidine synthetase-like protein